MEKEPINTAPLEQFLKQVKGADQSRSNEVRLDINQAKTLAFTLGIVLARLNGDLEKLIQKTPQEEQVIEVQMDGGRGF
tara:strand:+ start:467 stop:703 length:237 start_codon:yes stop_codon:yes gene_type:complete